MFYSQWEIASFTHRVIASRPEEDLPDCRSVCMAACMTESWQLWSKGSCKAEKYGTFLDAAFNYGDKAVPHITPAAWAACTAVMVCSSFPQPPLTHPYGNVAQQSDVIRLHSTITVIIIQIIMMIALYKLQPFYN